MTEINKQYWKKLNRIAGTYKIKNNLTQEQYVGSSKNIGARWMVHLSLLEGNKHHNKNLQESWNTYGFNNFSFIINEVCSKVELKQKEQELLELEKDLCFNTNYPIANEYIKKERKRKQKILTAEKGSQEWKNKISETMKGRNHNEETRKIMSEKKKEYWNKKRTLQGK